MYTIKTEFDIISKRHYCIRNFTLGPLKILIRANPKQTIKIAEAKIPDTSIEVI